MCISQILFLWFSYLGGLPNLLHKMMFSNKHIIYTDLKLIHPVVIKIFFYKTMNWPPLLTPNELHKFANTTKWRIWKNSIGSTASIVIKSRVANYQWPLILRRSLTCPPWCLWKNAPLTEINPVSSQKWFLEWEQPSGFNVNKHVWVLSFSFLFSFFGVRQG